MYAGIEETAGALVADRDFIVRYPGHSPSMTSKMARKLRMKSAV